MQLTKFQNFRGKKLSSLINTFSFPGSSQNIKKALSYRTSPGRLLLNPILHDLLIIGDKKFFVVIYQFKVILENDHIKLFVIAFSIWGFWSLLL